MNSYLSKIKKTELKKPIIMVQGDPGTGKSTFAGQVPNSLYLALENCGLLLDNVIDKDNFKTYQDVIDILIQIRDDKDFKFKAIIIDSLTALNFLAENWILDHNLKKGNVRSDSLADNENPNLNFAKGEKMLAKMFQDFIDLINEIRDLKNIEIVLLSHQSVKTMINGLEDDTAISVQVADINQRALNKVLASVDIVMQISKDYQLRDYGPEFRGNSKKIIKQETVVLRLNSNQVLGKVRDIYFDPNVVKNGLIYLGEKQYTLDCYPLENKDTMYADFEKLLKPELRLVSNNKTTTTNTQTTGQKQSPVVPNVVVNNNK